MADAIIVTPPPQVQNVAAGGQQTQSATEAGAPQPNLPPGTIVSGTIVGKDAAGNYLLKSPQGTFSIQSKVPLTYNSDVVIRLGANTAGNTTTRIVSVNGQPFADFATPEPTTDDSISPALQVVTPETPQAPATNALPAVVISVPAQQPAGAALQPGSSVIVRVPGAQVQTQQTQAVQQAAEEQASAPPQISAAPSASATVAVQPQQVAQTPQAPAITPQQPAAPSAQQTAATVATAPSSAETDLASQLTVTPTGQAQAAQNQTGQPQAPQAPPTQLQNAPVSQLYNVYTKQSAAASPPAPAATPSAPASTSATLPTTLPAQVISVDENGTLNLQTPLGSVTVQTTTLPALSSIAPGTAIVLELLTAAPQQAVSSAPASLTELASSWQSLKDIVSLLDARNTAAAGALLERLPQLGPGFLSQSSDFIAALLQGDARKLLGDDAIDQLRQQGRPDLVEKFSGELAGMGAALTTASQRPVPGWQTFFLPFVYQEALQQARLYVKRDSAKKERTERSKGETRFVLEVDLSELGSLQMDGLVRKKEQATAFDLVIRSHRPFSPSDRAEIADIFTNAAQLTGFKGSLAFHVTHDFPVKPLEEAAGEETRSITA